MSATREHRNASHLEDACAAIGTTITTFEHLYGALAHVLPDDFPAIEQAVADLVNAHAALQRQVVDGEQAGESLEEANAAIERLHGQWTQPSNGIRSHVDRTPVGASLPAEVLKDAIAWTRQVDALADTYRDDPRLELMRRWAREQGLPTTWSES